MADKISLADIERDYVSTVVVHKGVLCYFRAIDNNYLCSLRDIKTKAIFEAQFEKDDFTTVLGRIGMVSPSPGRVFYVSRLPRRVYAFGLTKQNTIINGICGGGELALSDSSMAKAYANEYPALGEAVGIALATQSGCAFDKQFAIMATGVVKFKSNGRVGHLPDMSKNSHINDIVWDKHHSMYSALIRGKDEKVAPAFRKAPAFR